MTGSSARLASSPARRERRRPDDLRSAVEARLRVLAPPDQRSNGLSQAMRHGLLAPGKRIRPVLTLLATRELGGVAGAALDPACAVEMVHAASLVLDDLPAMDDAATRRGRPSVHVAFGEDVAILASVSLLGCAFRTIAASELAPEIRSRAVAVLAEAIGHEGLSAGQHADLRPVAGARPIEHLVETNHRKTGSLFIAAVEIAGTVAAADRAATERLVRYAGHLGHAFQLLDDLQDGDVGTGEDAGRTNLLTVVGRADVRGRLEGHLREALGCLDPGGDLAAYTRAIFKPAGRPASARAGLPGRDMGPLDHHLA